MAEKMLCPGSHQSPPWPLPRPRSSTPCPTCGASVAVCMHRMDWRGPDDLYLADHVAPTRGGE